MTWSTAALGTTTSTADDVLYGGGGNDDLFGKAAHDIINGEGGSDLGIGVGNDYLYGGADADELMYGWTGRDYVSGGAGADRCLAVLDGDGETQCLGVRVTTRTRQIPATRDDRWSVAGSAWTISETHSNEATARMVRRE